MENHNGYSKWSAPARVVVYYAKYLKIPSFEGVVVGEGDAPLEEELFWLLDSLSVIDHIRLTDMVAGATY